ncbi:hypothetical protein [Pseudanabaena yagii]|uniref:Uncharacterized protein n=1 Tax=Pseudanabaena yagii GIHE-NHR1 TaxID=2722753 RepID=A0ABX1LPP3_9CYAN|nr:hypothetical protein [Pseudanabaena yagii]NMF56799.1 hypothetical protein [Pseudanabaena yagii GIHE-NHR1]
MFSATPVASCGVEDTIGGVQRLIDNGKSSQASESVPNASSYSAQSNQNHGVWSSSGNPKPLFSSLAGFALEVGDRLVINGEELIFKGWVDQSQTAIEVKSLSDEAAQVKQIRAKEIKSLARSPEDISRHAPSTNKQTTPETEQSPYTGNSEASAETNSPEVEIATGDRENSDQKIPNNSDSSVSNSPTEETPEIPKEPEYNAWEVWTYLERQRVKTLKLINTFHAEWEANRFVREAERSTPPNLRVHYEIRPVLLDEAELNGSYQKVENTEKQQEPPSHPHEEDYADAIDVEILT